MIHHLYRITLTLYKGQFDKTVGCMTTNYSGKDLLHFTNTGDIYVGTYVQDIIKGL